MKAKNKSKILYVLGALGLAGCLNLKVSANPPKREELKEKNAVQMLTVDESHNDEHGILVNDSCEEEKRAFFEAIEKNDISAVTRMISLNKGIVNTVFECKVIYPGFIKDSDSESKNNHISFKQTALGLAVHNKNMDMVKILVENGAKLYSDVADLMALQIAEWDGSIEIFRYLLNSEITSSEKKDIRYWNYWNFDYNLYYIINTFGMGVCESGANYKNNLEMVRLLIKKYKSILEPKNVTWVLEKALKNISNFEEGDKGTMSEIKKILEEELNLQKT